MVTGPDWKYGEQWVEKKLAAATEADLLRWGECFVDAKSLDEVFAG